MLRKKQYRLGTFVDSEAEIIYKYCVSDESAHFLSKLSNNYTKLVQKDPAIRFNKITTIQDDRVYFEFIKGKTLEQLLLGNKPEEAISIYCKVVDSFSGTTMNTYELEEGKKIFGIKFSKEPDCIASGIFDIAPSNIVLSDQGETHVIDYEWVFDFPIPRKYIAWRSAYLYAINNPRADSYTLYQALKKYFKISFFDEMKYFSLEDSFQRHVHIGKSHSQLFDILAFYFILLRSRFLKKMMK